MIYLRTLKGCNKTVVQSRLPSCCSPIRTSPAPFRILASPRLCAFALILVLYPNSRSKVILGSDQLSELRWLEGKNVGLVTNQTGLNSNLERTADVIHRNPRMHLKA